MVALPLWDNFNPSAACWRTEGMDAKVDKGVLRVDISRTPLRSAFSIPYEDISISMRFKLSGGMLDLGWGALPGQGYRVQLVADGTGGSIYAAGGKVTLASSRDKLIKKDAWHQLLLSRKGDDIFVIIDQKPLLKAKSARRYKGGAPLLIKGAKDLSISQVNIFGSGQQSGGQNGHKWDGKRCQCGPRVLEQWVGRTHGWTRRGNFNQPPAFKESTVKPLTQNGYVAMNFKAQGDGQGNCPPRSLRKVFKVGAANSSLAYVDTALIFGMDRAGEGHNFPHIAVELLDDDGKVLGSQRYYSPAVASGLSRTEAEKRKYAALPRHAGPVRLELRSIGKDIEFSQIAISINNYVCNGANDITLGQIIFCPDRQCGLGLAEAVDQKAILKEIEDAFEDFAITPQDLMQHYIEPPQIETAPHPPRKPDGGAGLAPAILVMPDGATPLSLMRAHYKPAADGPLYRLAAATDKGCGKQLQTAIDRMRRIKVSLGHDNQLKKALWDMTRALVKDVNFGNANLKNIQKDLDDYLEWAEWGHGLHGDFEAGKTDEVIQKISHKVSLIVFKKLHKKLLDECQNGLQLKKLSISTRRSWAKWLKTLKPNERRYQLARLKQTVGAQLSDDEFHRWVQEELFDKLKDVDVGTAGGKAAGRDYKGALETIITTGATAFSPQAHLLKAALTTYYESLRAVRDWVTDDTTQNLYDAYRTWHDEGQGGEDFFNAFASRDRYPLHKVRRMLAKRRGTTHDKVSDDEAWKYLKGEFAKWRKAEVESGKKADYLQSLKADFMALSPGCRRGLDKRLWPKGQYGLGHTYTKWFDACYYDVEALKRYAQLRGEVRAQLMNWRQPGSFCSSQKQMALKSRELTCKLLSDGEAAYRRSLAYTLDNCKWLPKPLVVMKARNKARVAPILARMSEARLQALLIGMGREDLLGCLCRSGILQGVNGGYRPKPLDDSPHCKNLSNGLCAGGNWGCMRFPVPTHRQALERCGLYDAVLDWQIKRRKGRAGP
jgi:hypothetical protein